MAVRQRFGYPDASAARCLQLRHDHGSNFRTDHFQRQIKSWCITTSLPVVGEPETNGVIEHFFRSAKEQVVLGHIYQTIDDVRAAVRTFVAR